MDLKRLLAGCRKMRKMPGTSVVLFLHKINNEFEVGPKNDHSKKLHPDQIS